MQIFIQGKDQRNAMDMREQLYMLEIEKHRGIKDAAQALHISPPALSIFLKNAPGQDFSTGSGNSLSQPRPERSIWNMQKK